MFARSHQPVDNLYAAFYDLAVNLSTGETEGRMAEDTRKVYAVGDKTFDTYDEAVAHRKNAGSAKIRNDVFELLKDSIDWREVGYSDGEPLTGVVEALFAAFNVTPKKPGKRSRARTNWSAPTIAAPANLLLPTSESCFGTTRRQATCTGRLAASISSRQASAVANGTALGLTAGLQASAPGTGLRLGICTSESGGVCTEPIKSSGFWRLRSGRRSWITGMVTRPMMLFPICGSLPLSKIRATAKSQSLTPLV